MRKQNGEKAKRGTIKSMAKLFRNAKPYKLFIIIAVILAIASAIISVVTPKMVSSLTQDVIRGGMNYVSLSMPFDLKPIVNASIKLLLLYGVSTILMYITGVFLCAKFIDPLARDVRKEISEKINKLPLKYFDSKPYGDTLSRITNDMDTILMAFEQCSSAFITFIVMVIGLPVMMFITDWRLTLIVLSTIPISVIFLGLVMGKSQKFFRGQQQKLGVVNGYIEEMYSGQTVIKAFNAEDKAKQAFSKLNEALYKDTWKAQFAGGVAMPLMNFVGNIGYALILGIGGSIALKSADPASYIAVILSFVIYLKMFNQQFGQFGQMTAMFQSAGAASERIYEFLDEPEMEDEKDKTTELKNVVGDIEFKDVCFGYNEDKIIINDFSAKIKAGSKVAIVGPTGAGKTTLVNLLMRFYEINSGAIFIDGINIKDLKRENIHSLFGMVLQDTWLFEGSVKDNLSFGRETTYEEVIKAAKEAHIHYYIKSMPNRYDTILDESMTISQGQKQLFTIARAMVENAPMLILDEATSNVDTRTEVLIQQAMDELMKGRTSFIIAHRLSTIKDADTIFVMNEGNIVEVGNHDELIEKKGFYYNLYNSQFENA